MEQACVIVVLHIVYKSKIYCMCYVTLSIKSY